MLKIADPNAEMGLTLDEIAREGARRMLMESAAERYPTKTPVLGAEAVLDTDPHDKPRRSKHSPAP